MPGGAPQTFDIVSEPAGATYRALLAFAAQLPSSVSLVWRHQLSFDAAAAAVARALRPDLIEKRETSEWPGTQLIGHSAIVRRYRLSPACAQTLAAAGGLYDWLSPTRPEDLAFYRPDGRCWLGSIAHERMAFVTLEPRELAALRRAVPKLELRRSTACG